MKTSSQTPIKKMAPVAYTIDAAGKKLGRVASEAASMLLGKKSAQFSKHEVLPVTVTINNASKLDMSEKRIAGKTYQHFTGYPGGLKETSMRMMIDKKGIGEVVRKTVDGMIPRNALRKERMKRLTVND